MTEDSHYSGTAPVKVIQDCCHIFTHVVKTEEKENGYCLNLWEISQKNETSELLQSILVDNYKYHCWSQNSDHLAVFTTDFILVYSRSTWEVFWTEQIRLQTIKEFEIQKVFFSFPVLYVVTKEESFLVNVSSSVYRVLNFDGEFQPLVSSLSVDGQFLAIASLSNDHFKIFSLDNMIYL
jgi:hypothetical protein